MCATRARDSLVPSIKSSRWNRSSWGRPYEAQAARNLVTLEVLTMPSSRGSGRTVLLERSLFISWHSTKPSRNASQNTRLSLSSPAVLSPLELKPEIDALGLLEELTELIPQIRSNLARGCSLLSTSSQSRKACSVLLMFGGGLIISLESIDAARRICSRCSGS